MDERYTKLLKEKLDADSFAKLEALESEKLFAFVADAVEFCKPDSVKVCDDSAKDIAYIRNRAVEIGEETSLAVTGHTVHFDGCHDQARDKKVTRYLVGEDVKLGPNLNQVERSAGLAEVRGFLAGSMQGKQAYVRFFCLGPTNSPFSISCVQITDSAYVAHSEDLLYRSGYEQFRQLGGGGNFFRFLHSAGRLGEANTSVDVEKRRVYIDIGEEMVYSVNTQYGGNTIGLKKLALRLAIRKADREGWLAEHMFIVGVHGPADRVSYFAGAFPSACGKTSTAMLPGETIVGDDIAYFRVIDGEARAVNVESGIFGIIRDVNTDDDPVIWNVLTNPGEVIFSNVLVADDRPYWLGMGVEIPAAGRNYCGKWREGQTDAKGNDITPSHKNARYTVALRALSNLDPNADAPAGVPVDGVIYGGRDSDTSVPIQQSFDWPHGVVAYGASLESETTAATLGAEGVRVFNLMSNLDFLAIPLGKYIQNNLDFGLALDNPPAVFGTNYFLKGSDGKYLNAMRDKAVWIKWAELRIHGDAGALKTPTGLIPEYKDLKRLFKQVLGKEYTEDEYVEQFAVRIAENLAKLDRIEKIYRQDVADTPKVVLDVLTAQRQRLEQFRSAKGSGTVSPLEL
ncbi:MAG: phosphoenolpyruvate carboxykinase (GTP) [Planctomycetota bacterium]|nr:phosphoenolpyruvate carboxykinase (GTP) [Planctomycetota bacterium]